jgi:hypothetical protein
MAMLVAEIRASWPERRIARRLSLAALTAAALATWYWDSAGLPGRRLSDHLGTTVVVDGRPSLIGAAVAIGLFWLARGRRFPKWDSLVLVLAHADATRATTARHTVRVRGGSLRCASTPRVFPSKPAPLAREVRR